jgi:hypothetical protein
MLPLAQHHADRHAGEIEILAQQARRLRQPAMRPQAMAIRRRQHLELVLDGDGEDAPIGDGRCAARRCGYLLTPDLLPVGRVERWRINIHTYWVGIRWSDSVKDLWGKRRRPIKKKASDGLKIERIRQITHVRSLPMRALHR